MIWLSIITGYTLLGLGLVAFAEECEEPGALDTLEKNLYFFGWPFILAFCALKRIWG